MTPRPRSRQHAVLVFVDGTICDTRHRHHLHGHPDFFGREELLRDAPVLGSVECLARLARRYTIVYMGARPAATRTHTEEWLRRYGFPPGPIYLAPTQEERLALVRGLRRRFDFVAGIGDRWDDNELHLGLGCLSIILKEFAGNWATVRKYLPTADGPRKRPLRRPLGGRKSRGSGKRPRTHPRPRRPKR